ncbi:MAG: translational GTPase TypA [Synergistaceae bacterium]|nr:translational GTPase TypA [Synergistaceae bacterium]
MKTSDKIRNVAIVAHIDHGKTTLIDAILRSAKVFRENAAVEERVMDSNTLERERGITIKAKHCSVDWMDYRINIVDTPGHADFSGEVERVLSMVDSVLLLVDAAEGPMPQTRYVLMRALRLGLKPIVIINKADRKGADPDRALNDTFDLFLELGASDVQADFPVLYGSGLEGWMTADLDAPRPEGMEELFQLIVDYVPAPDVVEGAPFLMQVSTLAWSDYLGRIGCGKVLQGEIGKGEIFRRYRTAWKEEEAEDDYAIIGTSSEEALHLWVTDGLERREVDCVTAGDIVWISGPSDITIGDTFASPDLTDPALPPLDIEEPTVSMFFLVNSGPFAGQEGRAVTIRQLRERLERELRTDVALRMEEIDRADGVKVSGRGDFHLAILIEEMRREGMEFCVSRPEVITRRDDGGHLLEPLEQIVIDVPVDYQGSVIEKLSRRKAELISMEPTGINVVRLHFEIPSRGLIGYRNEFLTDTRGLGILNSRFIGYTPWKGEISSRTRGSLVSMDRGECTSYQLENLQVRGILFVRPLDRVYEGMIVGEHCRPNDLPCNPTKQKALTNHRSATKDSTVVLNVPRTLSLEAALEWIDEDELVEVTPLAIRVRKTILDAEQRRKAAKRISQAS